MFNDSKEPDVFIPEFIEDLRIKMEKENVTTVQIDFGDNIENYYDILMNIETFQKEHFKVRVTSRDQPEIFLSKEESEMVNDKEVVH